MTQWQPVDLGLSGATVERSADGASFRKSVSGPVAVRALAAERDRVAWLAGTGVPGPTVSDWSSDGSAATLTTSAVPGMPLSSLPTVELVRVLPAVAGLISALHTLPVADCPFTAGVDVLVGLARERQLAGLIDESDFDAERSAQTAERLWRQLHEQIPAARSWESDSVAVTHGDLCLPNIMVDAETGSATGFVDLGLLGISDPYRDLALLDRSLRSDLNPAAEGRHADRLLEFLVPHGADPDRLAFYRLLDEFF